MSLPNPPEIKNPTIRIEEVMLNEDYTPPQGYVMNELKTSTNKGKGLFFAVLIKADTIPTQPQAKKPGAGLYVPKG